MTYAILIDLQLQTIKMLNQRLADMKKTLQNELKSSDQSIAIVRNGTAKVTNNVVVNNGNSGSGSESEQLVNNNIGKASGVVMDDVNLRYLKHVILKFLTSREVSHSFLIN